MKKINTILWAIGVLYISGPVPVAFAATLTASLKAPLTTPYVDCPAETGTADCTTGSMELNSPWTFSAGTIEIDEDEVSLRLDDLQLRDGLSCSTAVGNANGCNCWNDDNGECVNDGDCGSVQCGPNADDVVDNNFFTVYLYLQDLYSYLGTEKIRRDVNCHPTVNFDLVKTGTNSNRQVNQTVSVGIDSCGVFSEAHGVELRHIEVKDKYGNMVAKVAVSN